MFRHSQKISEVSPTSSHPQDVSQDVSQGVSRVGTSKWREVPVVGSWFGALIDTKNWLLGTEPVAIVGKTIVHPETANPSSSSNALINFEVELNELQQKLNELLQHFNDRVLNLTQEMLRNDMPQKCTTEMPHASQVSAIHSVLVHISDFFKSPDTVLREIEEVIAPQLTSLENQIRAKHSAFANTADPQVRATLKMDMLMLACDALNKFIQFVNAVQGEIKTAHARKEFEHALLNELVALVTRSLTNLPLPGIDMEPAYLNVLYEQIADTKTKLDHDFGQALGVIGEVMGIDQSSSSAERTNQAQEEIDRIIASLDVPTVPPYLRFQQTTQLNTESKPSNDPTRHLFFAP